MIKRNKSKNSKKSLREIRDKKILSDYVKVDKKTGNYVYTIKTLADKYKVSIPLIYKIIDKKDKK